MTIRRRKPATQPPPSFALRWLLPLLPVLLAGGTLAVFAGVAGHEFVNFDDDVHVYRNQHVFRGLSDENLKWAFGVHGPSQWHPLAWLSHQLDCHIFGADNAAAGKHHLVSLLLHTANVLLLFEFLRRATGRLWPSALTAALFGVHPLSVESVAWISERRDVLSTLFWMLTLLAYLGYARHGGAWRYLLVAGCLALGLMAKPMLVTLPCVLLLLDFWPLGRWRPWMRPESVDGLSATGCPVQGLRWLVWEKIPLLGLSAVSGVLTVLCQREVGAIHSVDAYPVGARLGNTLLSYGIYLRKMLWPADLSICYQSSITPPAWDIFLLTMVFLAGITAVTLAFARYWPYLAVGWLWYLGALTPVSGLVSVGTSNYADRYTYVPLIGVYLAIAFGARDLAVRWPQAKTPLTGLLAVWLVCLMVATWRQVSAWRDSQTLCEQALRVDPENPLMHNQLGQALQDKGQLDKAKQHYEIAVRYPNQGMAHSNLGYLLQSQGELQAALKNYELGVQLSPNLPMAHNNFGNGLWEVGRTDEAAAEYQQALRLDPDYAEAHSNWGMVLQSKEKFSDALDQYQKAVRLKADFAEAHLGWANTLKSLKRFDEAQQHYQEALRVKPKLAVAHNNLGTLLASQGKLREAIEHFRAALAIQPSDPQAASNLRLAEQQLQQQP